MLKNQALVLILR